MDYFHLWFQFCTLLISTLIRLAFSEFQVHLIYRYIIAHTHCCICLDLKPEINLQLNCRRLSWIGFEIKLAIAKYRLTITGHSGRLARYQKPDTRISESLYVWVWQRENAISFWAISHMLQLEPHVYVASVNWFALRLRLQSVLLQHIPP